MISATALLFASCANEETAPDENTSPEEITETIIEEEVVVEEITISDFMLGSWQQIGRSCDSLGNDCAEMSKESFWQFDKDSVTWSSFTHPCSYSNDTLYIVDSPYKIAGEMNDTITWHAVKTNRYMKLVRMKD